MKIIILGARVNNFSGTDTTDFYDPTKADNRTTYHQSGVVTPYAGIVYDLNDTWSVYTSYTQIYRPQTSKDADRKLLDPIEGDTYEAGIKAAFYDGRLNASFAAFRIEQDNVAEYVSGFETDSVYRAIARWPTRKTASAPYRTSCRSTGSCPASICRDTVGGRISGELVANHGAAPPRDRPLL